MGDAAMTPRDLIELSTDGQLSRAQREAVRSLKPIGEIVHPLHQATELALYHKVCAVEAAVRVTRLRAEGCYPLAVVAEMTALKWHRRWRLHFKAEAERIFFGMGKAG